MVEYVDFSWSFVLDLDEAGTSRFGSADDGGADLSILLFFSVTISSGFFACAVDMSVSSGFVMPIIAFSTCTLAFCLARLSRLAANLAL